MLKDPLWDFEQLGDGIHLYKPQAASTSSLPSIPGAAGRAQPTLIICCVWMFAAGRHAAKYFRHYQLLYPDAQILLLQNNIMNVTLRPDWIQIQSMAPAVEAVKDSIRKNPRSHILVHAFSGGGCHSVVQLAQAYRENVESGPDSGGDLPLEIPISAMVLDSSPPYGSPPLQTAVTASLSFLPKTSMSRRLLATPIAWAVIGSCAFFNDLGLIESSPSKMWRCLNDPEGPFLFKHDHVMDRLGFNPPKRTIPRTYILSKEDELVPHEHIVLHAAEARRKCEVFALDADPKESIRLEEFMGSAHVNHVSVDGQRYWQLVKDTVEKGLTMDEQT